MNRWIAGLVTNRCDLTADVGIVAIDDSHAATSPHPNRLAAWRISTDVQTAARKICVVVQSHACWHHEDDDGIAESADVKLHLIRQTRLFRFTDDIHLHLRPDDDAGGGTIVTGHSQSRIGKGDLGQNRRNLLHLRKIIRAAS